MGICACAMGQCQCTFGMAPAPFMALPDKMVMVCNKPVATIMDYVPMVNIMPFGMCQSLANPTVAAATASSLGVLTPMPCIPVTTAPWTPGSLTVLINGKPALNNSSKLMCNWGGIIQLVNPGQMTVQIP